MKTCRVCDKKFEHVWQVARHMRKDHPRVKPLSHKQTLTDPNRPRKKYTKHTTKHATAVALKYCPRCGLNLDAINVALNLEL